MNFENQVIEHGSLESPSKSPNKFRKIIFNMPIEYIKLS